MQLNPARGRKLVIGKQHIVGTYKVYAAQPREGTETNTKLNADAAIVGRFMQLNPARGRKLPRQDL